MKKELLMALSMSLALSASAQNIEIKEFRSMGPYPVQKPFMVDSVNVNSKPFSTSSYLDLNISMDGISTAPVVSASQLPTVSRGDALALAGFTLEASAYTTAMLNVEGVSSYELFIDGKKAGRNLTLEPGTHEGVIKYIISADKKESLKVSVESNDSKVTVSDSGKHRYSMKDVLLGKRFSDVAVSPDGNYMIVSYTTTYEGGRTASTSKVFETSTGKVIAQRSDRISWMPTSNKFWFTESDADKTRLVVVDPATYEQTILCNDLPQGSFRISPTEDFLIYSMRQSAPGEKKDIYEILTPNDRQGGYRSRSYVNKYDLRTGVMQQLTFGFHNSRIGDISADGKMALLTVSKERLTQRPTSISTLYLFNLETLEAEVLVEDDGFMGGAVFSPDGKQILLSGSPEAFGGVGMNVAKGQTPNMYDYQLYIMDLASKKIKPMTKDFSPCVETYVWNKADSQIYFTADDRDYIHFYKMNPKNGKISQISTSEDLVKSFSISSQSGTMAYFGQGAMNSDRLYTLDLKSGKNTLVEDLSAEIIKDVELGECHEWNFKNSKGETVYGRYYLPPHFDPSKKYPMIVNYYGGCTPTARNFESRYPHHAYAALGYVVYIVAVPSGATGNGQAWSARHVNTAGDGPAQDIIEGTKQFCREHSFVNENKVGCIGASYGGFMSQYIPTQTDFFATAISHAGISDHTSYWGFGYWGYSYSEVSMANSYPWSDRELYVGQSPLYNADKINTPILFVHGDADTNVPFNESIQMFTALKLLGKETALVAVKDQDHHILEYSKRLQWQNTIWAWFAKYLQDDPTWWEALYPEKSL